MTHNTPTPGNVLPPNAATGAWATQIVMGPYQPTIQKSLTE